MRAILKACLSTEQEAGISVGISRGRKSEKKEWPLEVRFKGLAEQKQPLGICLGLRVPRVAAVLVRKLH